MHKEVEGCRRCASCPLCSASRVGRIGKSGEYVLYLCASCDVVFADPMRTDPAFYEDSFDYSLRDEMLVDPLRWERRWDIEEFLGSTFHEKHSLLDVGCGTGFVVKRVADVGLRAFGIDFSKQAILKGREFFGLKNLYPFGISRLVQEFPGLKFDIVTMFQVIEHLDDPRAMLAEVKTVLNPGGTLVLSLPCRERWPDILGDVDAPPHHLTRWSSNAVRFFLEGNGFQVTKYRVETFPLYNMTTLVYHLALKVAPFLTIKGQKGIKHLSRLSDEEALMIFKKSSKRKSLANLICFPLWLLLKLAGARGPHHYIEARILEERGS